MMLRIVLATTLLLVPFAPVAAADPGCASGASGACGSANVECGVGTATGTSKLPVTWTLVVESDFESDSSTWTGTVAVLAAQTVCRIPGCTTASLYVNGALIDSHRLCQE